MKTKNSQVEVVVVSLGDYSWNVLMKKRFYAFPKNSRKVGKYFAFYKDKKIEYYSEVKKAEEGGKEDVGIGYWLNCLPDSEPPFQIVRFNKIIKLEKPIVRGEQGRGKGQIMGPRYTTFKKLLNSKTTKELF